MLKLARFVGRLPGAANVGLAFARLREMPPERAMSGSEWLTTQRAYGTFGRVAGVTFPIQLAATLTALGAVREVATVWVGERFNHPVAKRVVEWKPEARMPDWAERRDRREVAHAVSGILREVGLSARPAAALWGG